MKKLSLTLVTLLSLVLFSRAQYVDNALLFSQHNYGATARSKAMGNAFGALGGDFGSLSINPAGIGIYQRGEFSLTMGALNHNNTETYYQGYSSIDNNNNFDVKNIGYVSILPANENSSGLISLNFGIGYNRIANYNQTSFAGSNESPHSRMDAFAQNTSGIVYTNLVSTNNYDPYNNGIPWESKLAWENYLIDIANPGNGDNQYTSFLVSGERVKQTESTNREGYLNEYVATMGANFNHKLYLGATIGMQELFLDEGKFYSEVGKDDATLKVLSWGKFDYSSHARSTGVGYNLKLGAIYRPITTLRLGIALHTPTFFNIKETYSSVMSSTLTNLTSESNGSHYEETPIGEYQYNFNSPLRVIGSAAYLFAKKGMISVDYEFVDYGSMRFRKGNDGYNFGIENGDIQNVYQAVGNLRAGAEFRATDKISLRGGIELMSNPYKSYILNVKQPNGDYSFKTYNAGIGYRSGKFSLDVTYGLSDRTSFLYMYQLDNVEVEPVKYHSFLNELLVTFALRM